MLEEKRAIEIINHIIPSGAPHLNRYNESDAEIIAIDNLRLLFTTDEFSSEDLFDDSEPYDLGWNCAVGGLSDILATGGKPLFFAQAMVIEKSWDEGFISAFCRGTADVLKGSETVFIGGDLGTGKEWRYTASVIGTLDGRPPILRKGAIEKDGIYITGQIGRGNLQAAMRLMKDEKAVKNLSIRPQNRFALRLHEAALIREWATACIDTSDGVFNALNTIAELNNTGYEIKNPPYIQEGLEIAHQINLPSLLFLLGEGGEYELLFTINQERETDFLKRAGEKGFTFYKLGLITSSPGKQRILYEGEKRIDLSGLKISGRGYDNPKGYLKAIIAWADNYA